MATYQVLYWSDIPVQVRANEGRDRASKPLSDRFQEAVDAAAMAAGLIGSDAYTEQFRWSEPKGRKARPKQWLPRSPMGWRPASQPSTGARPPKRCASGAATEAGALLFTPRLRAFL